jgi:hypothetical protein
MNTLADPNPVSQSVSILVTDRHRSWPDEVRRWSWQPDASATSSWQDRAGTRPARHEPDSLRDLLVVVVRRCACSGDDEPHVLTILSMAMFHAIRLVMLRGRSGQVRQ